MIGNQINTIFYARKNISLFIIICCIGIFLSIVASFIMNKRAFLSFCMLFIVFIVRLLLQYKTVFIAIDNKGLSFTPSAFARKINILITQIVTFELERDKLVIVYNKSATKMDKSRLVINLAKMEKVEKQKLIETLEQTITKR